MIQLRSLEKFYEMGGGKFYVLRRITLDVAAGEFITIMGPSGAGKSTLLAILGMLDSAWSGEYHFLDEPVHKLKTQQRNELHKKYVESDHEARGDWGKKPYVHPCKDRPAPKKPGKSRRSRPFTSRAGGPSPTPKIRGSMPRMRSWT